MQLTCHDCLALDTMKLYSKMPRELVKKPSPYLASKKINKAMVLVQNAHRGVR